MVGIIFNLNDNIHFHSFHSIHIQTNLIYTSINSGIYCTTNSLFIHKKKDNEEEKEKIIKNNRCKLFH